MILILVNNAQSAAVHTHTIETQLKFMVRDDTLRYLVYA